MANDKVSVYLLTVVAVVSIIALVTIYVSMNDVGLISMPEEAIVGQPISTGETTGCTDSDGGNRPLDGGISRGPYETSTGITMVEKTDECAILGGLMEYYCHTDGTVKVIGIPCTICIAGTGDGAQCEAPLTLITELAPSGIDSTLSPSGPVDPIIETLDTTSYPPCEDSDGESYTSAGTVTVGTGADAVSTDDVCIDLKLTERTCVEGRLHSIPDIDCTTVRDDYVCLSARRIGYCGTPTSSGTGTEITEVIIRSTDPAPTGTGPSGTSPTAGDPVPADTVISPSGSGFTLDTPSLLEVLPAGHWKLSPAATNPTIIKFFFRGDISNVREYTT